jgi:hypothetical protein
MDGSGDWPRLSFQWEPLISERPFLLVDNNARLSLMILIGHVLNGLALSHTYHPLRASRAVAGVRDR